MGMDYNTITHKKCEHLTLAERAMMYQLHMQGNSDYRIAKTLGVASNTVRNESKRIIGYVGVPWEGYNPEVAQQLYEENRKASHRDYKTEECKEFLQFLYDKFYGSDGWSIDSTVGYAKLHNCFEHIPNTKTVYNWIYKGLIKIAKHELPEATKRKSSYKSDSKGPKRETIGTSIEERPEAENNRSEPFCYEIDTVIGQRAGKNQVLLTLTDRKTRFEYIRIIDSKTKEAVNKGLLDIFSEFEDPSKVFHSITADNGREFYGLEEVTKGICKVYYAHPYASYERGSNENSDWRFVYDLLALNL